MAINVNKIKCLAAEYEQAEARVDRLQRYIDALRSGKSAVSGIYIYDKPTGIPLIIGVPEDITDGMDEDYINDMYGVDFIGSMEYEKKDHLKRMDSLLADIKKELQL